MHRRLTLLFLHGFGCNGKIWDNQKEFFAHEYSSLTPDLDFSNLDSETVRLAKSCPQSTVIIGWSLGAFLGLKLYSQIPDKIKALVLVSAAPKFIKDESCPQGLPRGKAGLSAALFRNLERKIERDFLAGMNFFYDLMFNGERPKNVPGLEPTTKEAAMKCLTILKNADYRGLLPTISIPTLILHGEKDEICPPANAEYLKKQIPNSKMIIFKNEAHAPFLSNPKAFNRAIIAHALD